VDVVLGDEPAQPLERDLQQAPAINKRDQLLGLTRRGHRPQARPRPTCNDKSVSHARILEQPRRRFLRRPRSCLGEAGYNRCTPRRIPMPRGNGRTALKKESELEPGLRKQIIELLQKSYNMELET